MVYGVGFCADEFVHPVLMGFCVVLTAVAAVCGLMALLFCWVFGGMAVFVSWGWVLFNVVGFDSGGGCLLWVCVVAGLILVWVLVGVC